LPEQKAKKRFLCLQAQKTAEYLSVRLFGVFTIWFLHFPQEEFGLWHHLQEHYRRAAGIT
jgi:hypothetical protein